MRSKGPLGTVNGEIIGVILKEVVRRAITTINHQRFSHEAKAKVVDYKPGKEDLVTSADVAAQQIYLKTLRECFPEFGIVAEEDDLSIPCTMQGTDVWFTIDPLDGTKAFVRRQSHGVGTMTSLVQDAEIVAAYVGDVFTREIYGFRPGSDKVHRINEFEHCHQLGPRIDRVRPLSDQHILLRDEPWMHSAQLQRMLPAADSSGRFKGTEITGGSIGISMARLWKGEVGAAVLRPGKQTPWDTYPVYGISRKLGFLFVTLGEDGYIDGEWEPKIVPEMLTLPREVLIIHESRMGEFVRQP